MILCFSFEFNWSLHDSLGPIIWYWILPFGIKRKIMEKKNNWKWETLKKKKVGSDFLLIDITSIFYTHEKKWEIHIVMATGWCVVRFYWSMLGIGDDLPLSLGTHHNVLGLAFCIMIMIPSNVHLVGSSNNVLVVSDITCWYLVQVFLHCFGHLAVLKFGDWEDF